MLQVGFQVRLLAASKDVHRGRVYSHVGGCEVAGLNFPFFCGFVRCVLWAFVCVRRHTLRDPVVIADPVLKHHKS